MNWKVVRNRDLLRTEGLRIAYLKDQHWPHGLESQLLWMKENIGMDDAHLLGEEQNRDQLMLMAYSTLSNINIVIDDQKLGCIGVGGVCVDKAFQHSGMGRCLMREAAKYITEQGKVGILLCKEPLIPFYKKCGWKLVQYKSAFVASNIYEHHIMLLDKDCVCSNIIIEKNF